MTLFHRPRRAKRRAIVALVRAHDAIGESNLAFFNLSIAGIVACLVLAVHAAPPVHP